MHSGPGRRDNDRTMKRRRLSLDEARRIALAAQGLDRPRPAGRVDIRHVRSVVRRLGLLQLDYVNVLVPAHYQVLFSRLGPFDRHLLDRLAYGNRELTEQWAHEASLVPMASWPLLAHRREQHRVRPRGFEALLDQHADFVDSALGEIRRRGALTADELDPPESAVRRMSDTWGWARGFSRQVLEAHFGSGRLVVADRLRNFQRVYDLPERIVPSAHLDARLARDDQLRTLLLLAAAAHGIALATDLADYYRLSVRESRDRLQELVRAGHLSEVAVEGWTEPAYLHPKARLPRRVDTATLLSPFDPVIWTRKRIARLFGFDYRIEIFVPQPERRWGYYVLPFLCGDRLAARVDLKADRSAGQLLVRAAYLEPGHSPGPVADRLSRELTSWAGWLALGEIRVERRGDFNTTLRRALGGALIQCLMPWEIPAWAGDLRPGTRDPSLVTEPRPSGLGIRNSGLKMPQR